MNQQHNKLPWYAICTTISSEPTADSWNVDQIAEGLRALASAPDLRSRMGAAARAAIEKYTWDRVAAQTMAVYHEVVAQADRGNPPKGGR